MLLNRKYVCLICILRNKYSRLNNDLFRNHIGDNPLRDLCGVVDDITRYVFIVETI